ESFAEVSAHVHPALRAADAGHPLETIVAAVVVGRDVAFKTVEKAYWNVTRPTGVKVKKHDFAALRTCHPHPQIAFAGGSFIRDLKYLEVCLVHEDDGALQHQI